jgi:hypothetical protein
MSVGVDRHNGDQGLVRNANRLQKVSDLVDLGGLASCHHCGAILIERRDTEGQKLVGAEITRRVPLEELASRQFKKRDYGSRLPFD